MFAFREAPEPFHYLEVRNDVALKTEFKPTLKVLSRKPTPKVVARPDPITGLARMTLEDDDDDEDESKKNQPTAEERRLRAERERAEKQKKYEEVRARLFGTSSTSSTSSSPTLGPVDGTRSTRGKGRNRGGRDNRPIDVRRPDSQSGSRELYDPSYTPKPGSISLQKRSPEGSQSGRSTPKMDNQVIRPPRGPNFSSRGGFGFVNKGNAD